MHTTAAAYLADAGQVGLAARHLLAAGDPAAAFSLLSERVVRDFLVNPTIGSALDLDEIQPDLFAGAPEILVPLAARTAPARRLRAGFACVHARPAGRCRP